MGKERVTKPPKRLKPFTWKKKLGQLFIFLLGLPTRAKLAKTITFYNLWGIFFGQSSMKFEYKPLILKEKNKTANSKNKWATDDRKTSAKVAEVRPGQEKYKNLV